MPPSGLDNQKAESSACAKGTPACPNDGRFCPADSNGHNVPFHIMTSSLSRVAIATVLLCAPLHAQSAASVELIGPRGTTRTVTASEFAGMPHREVSAKAHMVSGRFSGVLLTDLLQLVGTPRGDSLRGPALATYVLIEAADGYRALFAAAELDAGVTDRIVLLADRKDGTALSAKDGPFQLIVPDEKRPARWVRQVRRLRVVEVPAASADQPPDAR